MTQFEEKFIIGCMDILHSILSSKAALKAAVNAFASNDINNPHYQLNTKIADHIQWSVKDTMSTAPRKLYI